MSVSSTKSFRELIVWQKAHQFVLAVYTMTKNFPKEEQFVLVPQFRRAAISIAANIAEGYKKKTKPEKMRFFNIAQGSIEECTYFMILAKDLAYTVDDHQIHLLEEVSKMLEVYIQKMQSSSIG